MGLLTPICQQSDQQQTHVLFYFHVSFISFWNDFAFCYFFGSRNAYRQSLVIAPRSPQHFFFFFFLGLHLSCVFFFFFLAGHGHGGQKTSGFGGGGHSASCNSSSSTSVSVSRERRRLRDRAHVRSSMTRRVLLHTSHSHTVTLTTQLGRHDNCYFCRYHHHYCRRAIHQ